jgi:hypothetical protein
MRAFRTPRSSVAAIAPGTRSERQRRCRREPWPATARVSCHRFEDAWPEDVEIVEQTPVLLCRRRGAAIVKGFKTLFTLRLGGIRG